MMDAIINDMNMDIEQEIKKWIASDAVLVADRGDKLQKLLYKFYLNCQISEMKITITKTETLKRIL